MARFRVAYFSFVLFCFLDVFTGCSSETVISQDLSTGIIIKQEGMEALHEELVASVTSGTAKVMMQPGLVAVQGGAHVKLLKAGINEILLPLPQLADRQVPICYFIHNTPQDASTAFRL